MEPFTLEKAQSDPRPTRSRRTEFARFDTEQRPRLIALLHALHGDRAFADRAATLALADAWLHWNDVRADDDPEAWVRRRARDAPARRRRARVPDDEWIAEKARPTLTAVLSLPMPERSVLVLHHIAGLGTDRIAAEEHRTAATVTELLARANRAVARSAGASPTSSGAQDELAHQQMANLAHALSYRSDLRSTDTVFRRAVGLRVGRAVTAVASVIVLVDGLAALWFAAQMLARLLGSS